MTAAAEYEERRRKLANADQAFALYDHGDTAIDAFTYHFSTSRVNGDNKFGVRDLRLVKENYKSLREVIRVGELEFIRIACPSAMDT